MLSQIKKYFGLACITVFFTVHAFAEVIPPTKKSQKVVVLSLQDAIFLTLRNNPQIKQDKIQRIADKFALVVNDYQFQPHYQLNASYQYQRGVNINQVTNNHIVNITPNISYENHYGTQMSINSANPTEQGTFSPQLTFNVTQPLIQGFGKPIVEAAYNNVKDNEIINQLNLKNGIITAVAQVINDYLTLVQDHGNLEVDQLSLKNYEDTVSNDNTLIKAGQMARSDIVQAQAQVESQKASIQNDLNNLDNDRAQLLSDLGLPPQTNITVPLHMDLDQLAKQMMGNQKIADIEKSEKVALANNISYQSNIIAIRSLRRGVLEAEDGRRWQLNVTASESRGTTTTHNGFANVFNSNYHSENIGVNLAVPIDDVTAQQAEINAKVGLEKALIALTEQKRQLLERS